MTSEEQTQFVARWKAARARLGETQEVFGRRFRISRTCSTLLENGRKVPGLKVIKDLANIESKLQFGVADMESHERSDMVSGFVRFVLPLILAEPDALKRCHRLEELALLAAPHDSKISDELEAAASAIAEAESQQQQLALNYGG